MRALYLLSVYLHIFSAVVWIGGIAFLVFVVVPWLRAGNQDVATKFLRDTGLRFRKIGWTCFAVLVATGTFNLWMRNVRLSSFVDPDWTGSAFGRTVMTKLAVFGAVLATSLVHDFFVGPRATLDPTLRKRAALLGRVNAIFALVILALAVMIVRGTPW
jgi:putative copper export protein